MKATCWMGLLALCSGPAMAASYPEMAPIAEYRMPDAAQEAALARSAAPASISDNAEVLVLGKDGYDIAAKGKNGFVCVVERGWGAGFDDPVFWNPHVRGPICFNAVAAKSVLAAYLERTRWVLAGMSKADMIERTRAAFAGGKFLRPEAGAMCYMLSKNGYLSDTGGHWHPHLMFFVADTKGASWGADVDGSPIISTQADPDPVTTFMVPVKTWSDGTPDAMTMKH